MLNLIINKKYFQSEWSSDKETYYFFNINEIQVGFIKNNCIKNKDYYEIKINEKWKYTYKNKIGEKQQLIGIELLEFINNILFAEEQEKEEKNNFNLANKITSLESLEEYSDWENVRKIKVECQEGCQKTPLLVKKYQELNLNVVWNEGFFVGKKDGCLLFSYNVIPLGDERYLILPAYFVPHIQINISWTTTYCNVTDNPRALAKKQFTWLAKKIITNDELLEKYIKLYDSAIIRNLGQIQETYISHKELYLQEIIKDIQKYYNYQKNY